MACIRVVEMLLACANDESGLLDGVYRGPVWHLFYDNTIQPLHIPPTHQPIQESTWPRWPGRLSNHAGLPVLAEVWTHLATQGLTLTNVVLDKSLSLNGTQVPLLLNATNSHGLIQNTIEPTCLSEIPY